MKFKVIASAAALALIFWGCATTGETKRKIDKNSPEESYQKALISSNYGLDDETIKYLNQALALDPGHLPSWYLLGLTHMKKGNSAEARTAFEKCVEIEPDNPDTRARLGSVYQSLGMDVEAESEFEEAYRLNQSFISSFNLAQFNLKRDNPEMALEYIQSAIKNNPESGPAYNLLGVILNKMKRYPEAIASFLNALKIDPNDFTAGANLGAAYINNKEYDKARELLTGILSQTNDPVLKEKISEYLEAIKNIREPAADIPSHFLYR